MFAISAGFVVLVVALVLVQFGVIAAMALVGIGAVIIAAILGAVAWLISRVVDRLPDGEGF